MNKIVVLVLVVLAIATSDTVAQFTKLKTIKLEDKAVLASVDRPGDVYVVYESSHVERYDPDGKLQSKGNLPFKATVFEPRDGARLFAYSNTDNQFIYFSPTLEFRNEPVKLDSAFAIQPFMMCSAGDHDLMVLDSADWSLKKINLKTNRLLFETIISADGMGLASPTSMREYQNFIFILDASKGILIYNMMGKLLKTVPGKQIRYFNFLGEELYYLENNQLRFFNLFNTETRSVTLPYAADFAFLTDERLYLVSDKKLEIFSLKP